MAAEKVWILFHATLTAPNHYLVRTWEAPGGEDEPPGPEHLKGYPTEQVGAMFMQTAYGWGKLAYEKEAREALWLDPKAEIQMLNKPGYEGDEFLILAYAIYVDFDGGDAQTLQDHGLDPETTTAEAFHDLTGEWPSGTQQDVRLEFAAVPTEYKNIVEDVRSMQDDGWAIYNISATNTDDGTIAESMKRQTKRTVRASTLPDALRKIDEAFTSKFWRQEPRP